jgi:hypothetical protein
MPAFGREYGGFHPTAQVSKVFRHSLAWRLKNPAD